MVHICCFVLIYLGMVGARLFCLCVGTYIVAADEVHQLLGDRPADIRGSKLNYSRWLRLVGAVLGAASAGLVTMLLLTSLGNAAFP
jgi:hypothetical protein